MQWFVDKYVSKESPQKVLDVGSYNAMDSYKNFFSESIFEYIGLDMVSGPNVDYIPESAYVWKDLEKPTTLTSQSRGISTRHSEFFGLLLLK